MMPESRYAWARLFASLLLATIGNVGMWSVVVILPAVQAEFGVARSAASLPYTVTMIGTGFGSILLGRLADRFGILVPVVGGALALGGGYASAGLAPTLWWFVAAQGLLGVASAATFAPLIADTSLWFTRRRGIAVAIIACGSYLSPARYGPRRSSTPSRTRAGAGRTWGSGSSAWRPCCRWRWPCGDGRR